MAAVSVLAFMEFRVGQSVMGQWPTAAGYSLQDGDILEVVLTG
ncbi:MAG: hypothetical protein VX745_07070 [Pseudomonadota bacterium]|nr:hypothetical protein [Pseudomonadota bacterium]